MLSSLPKHTCISHTCWKYTVQSANHTHFSLSISSTDNPAVSEPIASITVLSAETLTSESKRVDKDSRPSVEIWSQLGTRRSGRDNVDWQGPAAVHKASAGAKNATSHAREGDRPPQ